MHGYIRKPVHAPIIENTPLPRILVHAPIFDIFYDLVYEVSTFFRRHFFNAGPFNAGPKINATR